MPTFEDQRTRLIARDIFARVRAFIMTTLRFAHTRSGILLSLDGQL